MFNGKAEEAINFYTSVFDQSEINNIIHQEDGTVLQSIGEKFKRLLQYSSPINLK